jgi:hypothetical protein
MAIVASRLRNGELTFGGNGTGTAVSFACQATTVAVNPSYDNDGDPVEVLCGERLPAGKRETWTISGTSLQDFDDPQGFLAYCYTHAMETVAFTWKPNADGAPTWTGECVILALVEGGDVQSRLDTDWEFDIVGRPTRTYGTGFGGEVGAEPVAAGF